MTLLDVPSNTPTRRRTYYAPIRPAYLREARIMRGISQVAMAERARCCHGMIYRLESENPKRRCNASEEIANAIAEALGEPRDRLFKVATRRQRRNV